MLSDIALYASSASAAASSAAISLSLNAPRIVTAGSITVISFICSSIALMDFAADGAQDPFSTSATVRF